MILLFFISSLGGGGAERVMATLLNVYANKGYDVTVATNTKTTPIAYEIDSRVHFVTLSEDTPKATGSLWNKVYLRWWKYSRYRSIVKTTNPDVVVSFGTALNNDVIISLFLTKYPIICSEHTNIEGSLYKKKTLVSRSILYHFASAITVLTKHDYALWKNKYRNVVYMPNPCEFKRNPLVHDRKKVILAVGRVDQWKIKGFDSLIKVWARMCDDFPDWEVRIAGKYSEDSIAHLQSLIADVNCKRVSFDGFRSDIKDIMLESEVFCLPSRIEGLPMALIEAMNAGCCCVAFDCKTGPNEIITDGVSGILVKDQDLDALQSTLRIVLSNSEYRSLLASRAPDAVRRYSVPEIIKRWDDLFFDVMR